MPGVAFEQVEAFVREFTGTCHVIQPDTLLDANLGVTGGDGEALLEEIQKHFGVTLISEAYGYRDTFALESNEYLFGPEGLDLLGVTALMRWLRNEPQPVICDLKVGELHAALVRAEKGVA